MNAKTGRQYILHSSARAACAFSSSPSESVHDKTTLHRVVMKRSGRRPLAWDASDFTAADHLICTIVRQARNFPPAAGILHAQGGSTSCRRWVESTEVTTRLFG